MKGEAVALAKALVSSEEMLDLKHGAVGGLETCVDGARHLPEGLEEAVAKHEPAKHVAQTTISVARPSQRRRFGLVRTVLCGRNFEFLTASSVFSKRRVDSGTRLLIESMVLPKNRLRS